MGALCVKSAHTDVMPTVDGKKPVQVKQEVRVLNWDDPAGDIQKQDILEWLTDRRLKVLPLPDAIGRQVEPLLEAIANLPKEAEPALGASTANVHAYLSSLATYLSAFLDSLNKRERSLLCQAYLAACGALREKIFFKVYAALNRFNNNMIDRNDILFWLKNERSWKMKLTAQTKAAEDAAAAEQNGTDPAAKPAETQSTSDTFNITPITTTDVQTAIKTIEGKLFQWQHLVVILTYEDFDRLFDRWSIRLLKLLSEDTYYYQQLTDYFKSPTLEARLALVGGHQAITNYTSKHGSSRTGTRSTHSRHSRHSKHSRSGKGKHRKHKSRDKDAKSDADAIENDEFNPKDIEDHKANGDEKHSDEKQPENGGIPASGSAEKLNTYLSSGRRPSTQSVKSSSSRMTANTDTGTSEDDRSRPGSMLNLDAASTTGSASGGSARALISPRYGLDTMGASTASLKKHRSRSGHGRSHRHKSSHRDKDRPQSGLLDDVAEADKRKSRRDYDKPMSGLLEEPETEKDKEKEKDRKKHRHHSSRHHSSRHKSSSRHGTKSMPALTPEALARNAAAQLAADRELLASQGKLAEADSVLAAYQRGGASETKVSANGDQVVIEDADNDDDVEEESISAVRASASASATTPRGSKYPKEFAQAVNGRT